MDFTKRKPIKCIHCKHDEWKHQAKTKACPHFTNRGRTLNFFDQAKTFTPKKDHP